MVYTIEALNQYSSELESVRKEEAELMKRCNDKHKQGVSFIPYRNELDALHRKVRNLQLRVNRIKQHLYLS